MIALFDRQQRKRWIRLSLLSVAAVLGCLTAFAPSAQASIFDRIHDIYKVPDKLEALESEYTKTKEELEQQTEALNKQKEEMISQTENYMAQTAMLSQQNKSLSEQNEALRTQVEQMVKRQEDRAAFTRKVTYSVAAVLALGLLYLFFIRMWRYSVWRQQRRGSWRL